MEITTTNVKVNVLTATEGCYIYRKNEELKNAYFTKTVFLGKNDSPENYAEITEEQYNEIISQQETEETTETAETAETTEEEEQ